MKIVPFKNNHVLFTPDNFSRDNFLKFEGFPGFKKWSGRNIIVRYSGENIRYLCNQWPNATWEDGAESIRDEYLAKAINAEAVAKLKDPSALVDDSGYIYKREPMDHQRKAFAISRDARAFGLFLEQGCGKTKVTIDTACYLFRKNEIDALIIVAWPNGVHRNWVEYELPEDCGEPYVAEYWSSNYATKARQAAFQKVLDEPKKLKVFTFNIESLVGENGQKWMLTFLKKWRCLLVIDQSASIKTPDAKRTKFLINKCSELAPYRRILDGAPVAEGADEFYSQFKFLDPDIIGHDTWTAFRAEFCKLEPRFDSVVGYKNLDELRRRIDGYCFRVLADECMDLPERIYKLWPFDLNSDERRIFDDLKKKDLAFFDSKHKIDLDSEDGMKSMSELMADGDVRMIDEARALIKNLRLQQISSGWWPVDDRGPIRPGEHPSRLQALLSLLEQAEGKAIIFGRFRADLELIQATLGHQAVSYHGGIGEEDRATGKRRFMEDPEIKYFIGQPRSAGIGHTLTAARHVIFYANDSALRFREECEKRAHRKGLKTNLMIWDLIARGTQDKKIVRSLRSKKEISNQILQDPENFFLLSDDDEK